MEYPETLRRGTRKENIPPQGLRGQRNIQSNLNMSLFLTPGSRGTTICSQAGSDFCGPNPRGRNTQGWLRATPVRENSSVPPHTGLFQTNLAGPYGAPWVVAKNSLPLQQSNLAFKMQRRRSERGRLLRGLCPRCSALCSCSGQVSLKRSPSDGRGSQVPRATSRVESKDRYLLELKRGLFSASKRSCDEEEFPPGEPSPGSLFSLLATNLSRSHDFLPSGPALTLDSLSPPILVEGRLPPASRQAPLRSSQRSAALLSSVPWPKKEATSLDPVASLPWGSSPSSPMSPSLCKPQGLTTARLRGREPPAKVGCFGQASSSTSLACQEGDDSNSFSCCLQSSSGRQQATAEKKTCGPLRYLNRCDPAEPPRSALSFCGSQMSPGTTVKEKTSVCDSQRKEHLAGHAGGEPEVLFLNSFSHGKEDLAIQEPAEVTAISKAAGEGGLSQLKPWSVPGKRACSANRTNSPNASLETVVHGQKKGSGEISTEKTDNWVDPSPSRENVHRVTAGPEVSIQDECLGPEQSLGEDDGPMESRERSFCRSKAPLAEWFVAWHGHVCEKGELARSLYKRHLLQKGVGALKWAVELGRAQRTMAEKWHALVMLSDGFRKWRDAAAAQHKRSVLQEQGVRSGGNVYPPALERKLGTKSVRPEHLEGAPWSGRAGHRWWVGLEKGELLSCTTEARQGPRQPAGAVRRERRGPRAALRLEKTTLGAAFRRWVSRCGERRRLRRLEAWLERRLIGRCLAAWKSFARRKARSKRAQACRRAASLRVCFRQWSLMVQEREETKQTMVELLAAKRQRSHAIEEGRAGGWAPGARRSSPGRRWPRGEAALEGLFHLRATQEAFQTWRARTWEAQQASAFWRAVAHQRLRGALAWWRRRALGATPSLKPRGPCDSCPLSPGDPESAFPSSRSSRQEREIQLVESSPICIFSSVAAEDVLCPPGSLRLGAECLFSIATEFPVQGSCLGLKQHSECHDVRPGPQDLPERREGVRPISEHGWSQGDCGRVVPSVAEKQRLRDKYLRLWRHNARLRRARGARAMQQRVKAWLLWKEAFRTERLVRALACHRWVLWAWKLWRRRWVQLQVAGRFREAEEKQLLKAAFGRWRWQMVTSGAKAEPTLLKRPQEGRSREDGVREQTAP